MPKNNKIYLLIYLFIYLFINNIFFLFYYHVLTNYIYIYIYKDATGFIFSIFAIYFSNRHATRAHSFGFHRVEIIGVLVSILLIWVVTVFLVIEAIDRLRNPIEINGKVMLFTAVIGIIMNILLFFILGDGHDGHGHAHGHVHGGHHHHHHAHEHESDDSDKEVDECHDDHSYDSKNLKQKIKNFDKVKYIYIYIYNYKYIRLIISKKIFFSFYLNYIFNKKDNINFIFLNICYLFTYY